MQHREDPEAPLDVAVIVGSTREGRVGAEVARWFTERAAKRDDLALDVIDLADYPDFPASYPATPTEAMARFTGRIARADGFVIVTPEYNRSFPASLKQAIDYAYDEWHAKPVGYVAYGFDSRGLYAVEHLRCVFTELHAMSLRDAVGLHLVGESPGTPGDREEQAVTVLLDQLVWWGLALREARAKRPYTS
ncbi:NAD(P)H-dependent oxidoreductase [Streptomyces sp. TRM66268-LWL]|uniref:NAD(P)H-dependent oxidoreductase n=1 Tax=Streptomyces polyasparticus TaxID=2767826 RepID=A0ABR7SFW3_9ACTN|nr:NAD(P)H-dependent oxidoreductase [Streptomyces polyasparticus]MBC9714381.1 NAD(P)H-dependent oxidoreductase [Streptomyces polyasparticus]